MKRERPAINGQMIFACAILDTLNIKRVSQKLGDSFDGLWFMAYGPWSIVKERGCIKLLIQPLYKTLINLF